MQQGTRFEALDSWRGIAALLVALFHFDVHSNLTYLPLVRHSYLFVDFFFVLSGFVIAASYQTRLAQGFGLRHFMALRLARIYPLHLVLLLVFIPIDWAKDGMGPQLVQAIGSHVMLLQGVGVNDQNWLNFPTWSISAEMASYGTFAVVVALMGRSIWPWLLVLVSAPILLFAYSPFGIDATFDFGFVRALYGFAMGLVCHMVWQASPKLRIGLSSGWATLAELAVVAGIFSFISLYNTEQPITLLVPFVFAPAILIFAQQRGLISELLRLKPLLLLGMLSYSLYMIHAFVRAVSRACLMVLEKLTDWTLFQDLPLGSDGSIERLVWLDGSLWLGDLFQLVLVAITIGLSIFTYRFIEMPGQKLVRNWYKEWMLRKSLSRPPSLEAAE